MVKVGDEIEVKILRVDRGERKIGLSRKKAQLDAARGRRGRGRGRGRHLGAARAEGGRELKGGLSGGGPLFTLGGTEEQE